MTDGPSGRERAAEPEDLRVRLAEAEEVLRAIRNGEVDAVVVDGGRGEQVYTLSGADRVYRRLVETMSEGAATLSANGGILYCNVRLAQMLGRPLDQVMGTDLRNYLSPADYGALDAILTQTRIEISRREINLKTSGGDPVPVYLSASRLQGEGAQMVFCLVLTDLTEQKSHEQIAVAERLARLILEQAAGAIVVCDEEGRVIRASQAAQQFCDGSPLLRPFDEVFALRKDASGQFDLAPVLRGETLRGVDVCLDRQGQKLDLILNAGPLESGRRILGCVVTLTDITERKRAEVEVKTMTQQLWQAAKLATMGELAASLAHELNNPLATVSMRIESLRTGLTDNDPRRQSLEIVEKEIDRMARLVADLLQFGRRSQPQISTIDVREEVEKTLDLIQYHLRKRNMEVHKVFTPDARAVLADRQQLRQVFLNLFTNAADAMPGGGTLTISVSMADSPSQVLIEVSDTGSGIAPEILPKIMTPFFTTKPEGEGTGLGLPICRRIIQEHRGEFGIASEVGKGTTVSIRLPAAGGGKEHADG